MRRRRRDAGGVFSAPGVSGDIFNSAEAAAGRKQKYSCRTFQNAGGQDATDITNPPVTLGPSVASGHEFNRFYVSQK